MAHTTDVSIIGGGVLGVSLAYHLSQNNISCVLFEREPILGIHASGKNAGMIRQLYRHHQLTSWAKQSIDAWQDDQQSDLCNDLRAQNIFKQTGSYIVGRTSPDHHSNLFTDTTLFDKPTVFTKTDGLLDSSPYLNTLAKHCNKDYVQFRLGTKVTNIANESGTWKITTKDISKEPITSKWLVNAAGAWIEPAMHPLLDAYSLAAKPFARHLIVVAGWDRALIPSLPVNSPRETEYHSDYHLDAGFVWDEDAQWYLRLWDLDTRLVSICDQTPACPETFVPDALIPVKVAEKLIEAFPTYAQRLSIAKSWHCFRTYTSDKLPIWGESTSIPKLFWLAAFGGFGMSTAFAATKDAALHIAGDAAQQHHDFNPDRVLVHA